MKIASFAPFSDATADLANHLINANIKCGEKTAWFMEACGLELSEFFEVQRNFDRQVGWNKYEQCDTPEETVAFMEHLTLAIVDELGEISRVRKRFLRDQLDLDTSTLRKEFVDLFIFVMQGSMALKMNLEDEYNQRMRHNEQRFIKKHV